MYDKGRDEYMINVSSYNQDKRTRFNITPKILAANSLLL